MEEKEVKKETREKMTYEQLENVAHQLSEQAKNLHNKNQQLIKALEEANTANYYRRLDALWAVITSDTAFLSREFKIKCGEEVMAMMTPPEETKE